MAPWIRFLGICTHRVSHGWLAFATSAGQLCDLTALCSVILEGPRREAGWLGLQLVPYWADVDLGAAGKCR